MKCKVFNKNLTILALALMALALTAGPSFSADITVNLAAVEAQWLPPGGGVGTDEITMWGFIEAISCPTPPVTWDVGVEISALAGDNLTINVLNCLSEPVSIMIPGQAMPTVIGGILPGAMVDPQGRQRFTSFVAQADVGGSVAYTWTGLKAGTYLYASGTYPAKQVPMGLYGALKVDFAAGPPKQAYDGKEYDNEVVVLYSEIDPMLHDDPPATAQPLNYKPEYFLINGQPYPNAGPIIDHSIVTNENVLIRFLNAGLKTHVPTLLGGYMSVIAEDGNLYPYAKEQYSVLLAAGKTVDALWVPATDGTYPVYDARHYLTSGGLPKGGMLVKLEVGPDGSGPVANPDAYEVDEDETLSVTTVLGGVLGNDTGGTGPLIPILIAGPFAGTLTLDADGSFTYEPDQDFFGTDGFTYKANDGTLDSNLATVTITVNGINDAPVAVDDTYSVVENEPLTVAAPGVLGNDTDVDGDTLTALLDTDVTGGTLILNLDGSFDYTPVATGDYSFTYFANDDTLNSSVAATVTITVVSAANQLPVAEPDTATTSKNTAVDINVIANDYDPDGFIFPGSVVIVSPPANGTAVNNANGTVTYTPAKNYTGPDSFTYIVYDNNGDPSSEATVTVEVTKK